MRSHPLADLARAVTAPTAPAADPGLAGFLDGFLPPGVTTDAIGVEDRDRAYADVKRRTDALTAWGVDWKTPEANRQMSSLHGFQGRWEALFGNHDASELRAAANDLAVAEGLARAHGFGSPDVPPEGPRHEAVRPVPVPPIDAAHPFLTAVDHAAPGLPGAPRGEAGPPLPDPMPAVPLAVRVAALLTLAGASVATVAALKSDSHRAAAAGSGTIVVVAAAWAMFYPASKGKKP